MSALLHIGLMAAGFLLMTAGVFIAIFMRKRRWWLKAHKASGTAAALCMSAGLAAAVIAVENSSGIHFGFLHARMGVLTLLGAVITPSIGFMQFRIRTPQVKVMHRWLGRLTLAFAIAAIVLGLSAAGYL